MKMFEFRLNFTEVRSYGSNWQKIKLVQLMAWRRIGDKPLNEPMMAELSGAQVRHPASVN